MIFDFLLSEYCLGFHEGGLVVHQGLTPQQAEDATALHGPLIDGHRAILFCFIFLYLSAAGAGPWSVDALRGKG